MCQSLYYWEIVLVEDGLDMPLLLLLLFKLNLLPFYSKFCLKVSFFWDNDSSPTVAVTYEDVLSLCMSKLLD